jgi:hypothetical protein
MLRYFVRKEMSAITRLSQALPFGLSAPSGSVYVLGVLQKPSIHFQSVTPHHDCHKQLRDSRSFPLFYEISRMGGGGRLRVLQRQFTTCNFVVWDHALRCDLFPACIKMGRGYVKYSKLFLYSLV